MIRVVLDTNVLISALLKPVTYLRTLYGLLWPAV
jgi:predicted nucleic acid-binding protein